MNITINKKCETSLKCLLENRTQITLKYHNENAAEIGFKSI